MVWLEALLAQQSLAAPPEFFKATTRAEKPSKAILQVYFRQADACVVTTNVYAVAGELNPQLQRDLRVVAVSPELVPALFYFRPGDKSRAREELEPAILGLHETPAGQQVLTIFQCDRMVKSPTTCLATTRELLKECGRLKGAAPQGPSESVPIRNPDHAISENP
jgi:ABC-type phosphate/phosphonate transport system substrate-binding protein